MYITIKVCQTYRARKTTLITPFSLNKTLPLPVGPIKALSTLNIKHPEDTVCRYEDSFSEAPPHLSTFP